MKSYQSVYSVDLSFVLSPTVLIINSFNYILKGAYIGRHSLTKLSDIESVILSFLESINLGIQDLQASCLLSCFSGTH
jgi:hypothetical protein